MANLTDERKYLRHVLFLGAMMGVLLPFQNRATASTTFSDGTFPDANWSDTKVTDTTVGQTAFSNALQETSGGNPDFYRMTNLDWAYDGTSASQGIRVAELNSTATYSPSGSGAIGSISFSIDGAIENRATESPVGDRPVAFQDGTYYFGPEAILAQTFNVWQPDVVSGLTASDFSNLPGSSHPNFSSTGDPIEFGYSVEAFSTPADASPSEDAFFYGIGNDNWSVTLNTVVPEPATLSVFALAATGLLSRRSRKQ